MRVLTLDLEYAAVRAIEELGHDVMVGSLGQLFKTSPRDLYVQVPWIPQMPTGWEDARLVVIDLGAHVPEAGDWWIPKHSNEEWFYFRANGAVVDSRVIAGAMIGEAFEDLLKHGALFVVFADGRFEELAFCSSAYTGSSQTHRHYSVALMPSAKNVRVFPASSTDLEFEQTPIAQAMKDYGGWNATCCFGHHNSLVPLAHTSIGYCAAGQIWIPKKDGSILYLPQCKNTAEALTACLPGLIDTAAPHLSPRPHLAWLGEPLYTPDPIEAIRKERKRNRDAYDAKDEELAAQQASLEDENADLISLLTATGHGLVKAVASVLRRMGFRNVTVMDDEKAANDRAEDIRIDDPAMPLILVEVKGIAGAVPRDEDVLASNKYLASVMKETRRMDVKAVTVLNHDRHREPALRGRDILRPDLTADVEQKELAVILTWDLYRLCLDKQRLGWSDESVKNRLLDKGIVAPLPTHYLGCGTITHYYATPNAYIINMDVSISLPARLSVQLEAGYFEWECTEVQVDGTKAFSSPSGHEVGLVIPTTERIADGTTVYVVSADSAGQ